MSLRITVDELMQTKYATRKVVAVDGNDQEIQIVPIIEAHREPGIKHRAFSLVLYRKSNGQKELLLQKRAEAKPAFTYLWGNTCCYNMGPGEEYLDRAATRVKEEMGVDVSVGDLRALYRFSYYAPDIEGWCENEWDTVIVGEYGGSVELNPEEADDYKWITWEAMVNDMSENSSQYVPWWKIIVEDGRLKKFLEE